MFDAEGAEHEGMAADEFNRDAVFKRSINAVLLILCYCKLRRC